MTVNTQMLGNAALMALPKVVFLSSRRVPPAAVMRCYDWATEMRGGGRGATALPSGHEGRVPLPPDFAKCGGRMFGGTRCTTNKFTVCKLWRCAIVPVPRSRVMMLQPGNSRSQFANCGAGRPADSCQPEVHSLQTVDFASDEWYTGGERTCHATLEDMPGRQQRNQARDAA